MFTLLDNRESDKIRDLVSLNYTITHSARQTTKQVHKQKKRRKAKENASKGKSTNQIVAVIGTWPIKTNLAN